MWIWFKWSSQFPWYLAATTLLFYVHLPLRRNQGCYLSVFLHFPPWVCHLVLACVWVTVGQPELSHLLPWPWTIIICFPMWCQCSVIMYFVNFIALWIACFFSPWKACKCICSDISVWFFELMVIGAHCRVFVSKEFGNRGKWQFYFWGGAPSH